MKIPFCKPTLGQEEQKAVMEVLESGWLAAGEKTAEFEKRFCQYIGAKYCIFTNSGTAALKMAFRYVNEDIMKKNPEEGCFGITYPKNTFCATYAAAYESGLWFLNDYDEHPNAEWFDKGKKIIPKSKPITPWNEIIVNLHYGGVKDIHSCYIEDSAHRIEKNDPLVGKIRCYSFYVTKNMTTGSGGMFVTNNKEIYEKARLWWQDGISTTSYQRHKGEDWNYQVKEFAGGYDGNDIAAAIGMVQLQKLPEFTKKRNAIRDYYNKEFGQDWQGNHLYPIMLNSIKEIPKFIKYMQDKGIACSYHYPPPEITKWKGVSLPIYPRLTKKEMKYIVNAVHKFRDNNSSKRPKLNSA